MFCIAPAYKPCVLSKAEQNLAGTKKCRSIVLLSGYTIANAGTRVINHGKAHIIIEI
jgi:hypothetical protein